MSACLIAARAILVGVDSEGGIDLRYDAALRIDGGRVVQIGTWEAVSYGGDHLPRYGGPDFVALPRNCADAELALAIANGVVSSSAARGATLRPGASADLVLFDAQGVKRQVFLAGLPEPQGV